MHRFGSICPPPVSKTSLNATIELSITQTFFSLPSSGYRSYCAVAIVPVARQMLKPDYYYYDYPVRVNPLINGPA